MQYKKRKNKERKRKYKNKKPVYGMHKIQPMR
jgi:hypothetical protein